MKDTGAIELLIKPVFQRMQFSRQGLATVAGIDTALLVCVQDEQLLSLPICFEVNPANDSIADPKRQYIVTPTSLVGGNVDFNAIVKIKQALGARPKPNDRVKWRQQ